VAPRAGLDAEDRRKILCLCRGSNPDRPARSQTLYCLSYRVGIMIYIESSEIIRTEKVVLGKTYDATLPLKVAICVVRDKGNFVI
jgi:hypothetical protein